ncbi:hypothetical protein Si038_00769 [Streptococcus infantarius subsp. infantarius]|nr:hypothetical protein [Streptococcus infantarius subsp. infantarius]
MNKQELIEKLKSDLTAMSEIKGKKYEYDRGYEQAIKEHLVMLSNLDWPEKPVVPQYVADFYESIKYDFEYGLYKLYLDFNKRGLQEDLGEWFGWDVNKPIETLVKMKLYGYEVEKEKLYTVEIPNPNRVTEPIIYLSRGEEGKIFLNSWFVYESKNWKNQPYAQLTEQEIKEDFEWAWQFAKEVKE